MNKKRTFRISVGIILLIVLIISIVPKFYLHTSTDGVISARTVTMTSPIEGVLNFPHRLQHGECFKKNAIIGTITNNRIDLSFLHELITEQKTLNGRIKSFNRRIKRYKELNAELKVNLEKFRRFSDEKLRFLIQQNETRVRHQQVEYERAKKELMANRHLESKKAVNKRDLERSEADFIKTSLNIQELKQRLKELLSFRQAVKVGTFLGEGNNDSPYSKQRMDQLVIELALADSTLTEATSRIKGIEMQIKTERERIKKIQNFNIKAPSKTLAWRLPLVSGSTVVIGDELIVLLDCSSIFLDVVISESQFMNIKPGMKIKYRLMGGLSFHEGTVDVLRGSGSNLEDKNMATELKKDSQKEFRVWIEINPKDLELKPDNFFQVGRRVEVRMPRTWSVTRELIRFWHVF